MSGKPEEKKKKSREPPELFLLLISFCHLASSVSARSGTVIHRRTAEVCGAGRETLQDLPARTSQRRALKKKCTCARACRKRTHKERINSTFRGGWGWGVSVMKGDGRREIFARACELGECPRHPLHLFLSAQK